MIRENIPLASFTYYKIGGPARYFAQPQNEDELREIAEFIKNRKLRLFILGAGSNVLFDDRGFDGLVLNTSKIDRRLSQEQKTLETGAGVMVIQLLRHCMSQGIGGFEFLVGVPGNMGGVFYMNAGTKLGEIKDVVTEITVFNLDQVQERILTKDQLKYTYRAQHFLKPREIILRGKVAGQHSDPKTVQEQVQRLLEARKRSQPIDKPSCGSVFKNPDSAKGQHAWKLIDDAGLRGFRIGAAQISELHTNFIVNLGGAKASDVRALIQEAKKRVHDKFGLTLEEEVRLVSYGGSNEERAGFSED